MSSLSTRIHSGLPYSRLNDVRRVLCYLEWWISRVRIRLIIILLTFWSEIFSSFDSSLGLKCVFFFWQTRPLFLWKRLFLESILLIFGFFWILLRVANLAPSPSYIIFLFSKLFFTFAFCLLPFPFYFLFSLKLLPAFLSWLSHARQIYLHGTFLHPLYTQHGVSVYSLEPTFLSLRIHALISAVWLQEWLVHKFFILFLQFR